MASLLFVLVFRCPFGSIDSFGRLGVASPHASSPLPGHILLCEPEEGATVKTAVTQFAAPLVIQCSDATAATLFPLLQTAVSVKEEVLQQQPATGKTVPPQKTLSAFFSVSKPPPADGGSRNGSDHSDATDHSHKRQKVSNAASKEKGEEMQNTKQEGKEKGKEEGEEKGKEDGKREEKENANGDHGSSPPEPSWEANGGDCLYYSLLRRHILSSEAVKASVKQLEGVSLETMFYSSVPKQSTAPGPSAAPGNWLKVSGAKSLLSGWR